MKLSKTSAHAALAMAFLARQDENSVVQARQVAEHLGIPTDSALKVLQNLVRRGLIHSQLGRRGGYLMRKSADQITLLHIVEAVDGPIDSGMPLSPSSSSDSMAGVAMLRTVCDGVASSVRTQLSSITVADILKAQPQPNPVLQPVG